MGRMEKIRDYCIKQLKEIESVKKGIKFTATVVLGFKEKSMVECISIARAYELKTILKLANTREKVNSVEKIRSYCIDQLKEIEVIDGCISFITTTISGYSEKNMFWYVLIARKQELKTILELIDVEKK